MRGNLFCWYWWNWWPSLFRGNYLFCWYWWNWWPSLFTLSFHNWNCDYPLQKNA